MTVTLRGERNDDCVIHNDCCRITWHHLHAGNLGIPVRMSETMTALVMARNKSVNCFEEIIDMTSYDMYDEIIRLFFDGLQMSVIEGKIGMVSNNCKRIYDFTTNQMMIRNRA